MLILIELLGYRAKVNLTPFVGKGHPALTPILVIPIHATERRALTCLWAPWEPRRGKE
jgi:hypothetical protein